MISVKDYKIEVAKLTDEDGGGYIAHIPQLGCFGDGDTIEAAIADVYTVAEELISIALEDGKEVPEPQPYKDIDEFSGKLSLRIPKTLHKHLNQRSKMEDCSINQLILSYISMGLGDAFGRMDKTSSKSQESFDRIIQKTKMTQNMWPKNDGKVMYSLHRS